MIWFPCQFYDCEWEGIRMSEEEKKENELLNISPVEEGDKDIESCVTENVEE